MATTDPQLGGHVLFACPPDSTCCDDARSCMFCDGGLSACTRCGAFEGAWPDECPGEGMTPEQVEAVYAGRLNYRDGAWHEGECCQVMRHAHDRDAWMAEYYASQQHAAQAEQAAQAAQAEFYARVLLGGER